MSGWTIYWITRLDELKELFTVVSVIGLVSPFFFYMASDILYIGFPRRLAKRIFFGAAILAVVTSLTPSSKDVAAIYIIPRVANSETVNQLGDEALGLVREWMNELKPGEEK